MLTVQEKIERLEMSIALLRDADCGMQAALGEGDLCYELHNKLEELADDLQSEIDTMRALAMQGIIV